MTPEQKAEQFYNQFAGQVELHWPALYVKGKYGDIPQCVCFIPDCNNDYHSDYSYYKGVYVDFNFETGISTIIVDGHDVSGYFTNPLTDLIEREKRTVFENFLIECLEGSEELFKVFEEQQND